MPALRPVRFFVDNNPTFYKGTHRGVPLREPMYNPEIHKRRSLRLKNYDYSSLGAYFVTLCAQSSECVFGRGRPPCLPFLNAN